MTQGLDSFCRDTLTANSGLLFRYLLSPQAIREKQFAASTSLRAINRCYAQPR